MFREKPGENPDLDPQAARFGKDPTDGSHDWDGPALRRWAKASRRSFRRRKAAALEQVRRRKQN
jgi:hypothetical protein